MRQRFIGVDEPYNYDRPDELVDRADVPEYNSIALLTTGTCPHVTKAASGVHEGTGYSLELTLSEEAPSGTYAADVAAMRIVGPDCVSASNAHLALAKTGERSLSAALPSSWEKCVSLVRIKLPEEPAFRHGFNATGECKSAPFDILLYPSVATCRGEQIVSPFGAAWTSATGG